MNESHTRGGEFRREADNLFRYSSSGVYYARFQSNGKDICRSLLTAYGGFKKSQAVAVGQVAPQPEPL